MKFLSQSKHTAILSFSFILIAISLLFAMGTLPVSAYMIEMSSNCSTEAANETPLFILPGRNSPTPPKTSVQPTCTSQSNTFLNGTKTLTPVNSLTPTSYNHYPQLPGVRSLASTNGFNFSSFTSSDFGTTLIANGSAHYGTSGTMLLTSNTVAQSGSVWYSSKQLIGQGFSTTFEFQMTNGTGGPAGSGGADGIAFVVQMSDAATGALGPGGCSIGYEGLRRSFVTEFDTFRNGSYCGQIQDPPVDHVAIKAQVEGSYYDPVSASHDPILRFTLAQYSLSTNLKDGIKHRARIVYIAPQRRSANPPIVNGCVNTFGTPNAGVWCVYIDNMTIPVIVRQDVYDLWSNFAGDLNAITDDFGMAYIGFTAGTGTSAEQQEVTSWSFAPFTDCSVLSGTPTNTPIPSATPCSATSTPTVTSTITLTSTPLITNTPGPSPTPCGFGIGITNVPTLDAVGKTPNQSAIQPNISIPCTKTPTRSPTPCSFVVTNVPAGQVAQAASNTPILMCMLLTATPSSTVVPTRTPSTTPMPSPIPTSVGGTCQIHLLANSGSGLVLRDSPVKYSPKLALVPWDSLQTAIYKYEIGQAPNQDIWYQINQNNQTGWIGARVNGTNFIDNPTNCLSNLLLPYRSDWLQIAVVPISSLGSACDIDGYLHRESEAILLARLIFGEAAVYKQVSIEPNPDTPGTNYTTGGTSFLEDRRIAWIVRMRAFLGLKNYGGYNNGTGKAGISTSIQSEILDRGNNNYATIGELRTKLTSGACTYANLPDNVLKMVNPVDSTTASGVQIYQLWRAYQYALIIKDYQWDGFDGRVKGYDEFRGVDLINIQCSDPRVTGISRPYPGPVQEPFIPKPVFDSNTDPERGRDQQNATCFIDAYHLDDWFWANKPNNLSWANIFPFPTTQYTPADVGVANGTHYLAKLPGTNLQLWPP